MSRVLRHASSATPPNTLASVPPGATRRGRPRQASVDPATLEVLGIPQVLAFCRSLNRPLGRDKLQAAISRGELPAVEDTLCLGPTGQPVIKVRRLDLLAWLASTLRPVQAFNPSLNEKGPLPRAL